MIIDKSSKFIVLKYDIQGIAHSIILLQIPCRLL